jgi:hypothetical protein
MILKQPVRQGQSLDPKGSPDPISFVPAILSQLASCSPRCGGGTTSLAYAVDRLPPTDVLGVNSFPMTLLRGEEPSFMSSDQRNARSACQGPPTRPTPRRARCATKVPTRGRADSRQTLNGLTAAVGGQMVKHQNPRFNLTDVARTARCWPATVYGYVHSGDDDLAGVSRDFRSVRRDGAIRTGLTGGTGARARPRLDPSESECQAERGVRRRHHRDVGRRATMKLDTPWR